MGHMNIKRIIHRLTEELDATIKIAKVINCGEALNTLRAKFDIQVMNRNGYKEPESVKKRLLRKHETMLKYVESQFQTFLKEYTYDPILIDADSKYMDKIWVCWWQGLDNAPEIVKQCVASIKKNTTRHDVFVITDDNYHDLVNLPKWVEDKRTAGIISQTHYSDLLRLEVLARYGGVWIDSTFYCVHPWIDELFDKPIWSIKRPDYLHCSIAGGQFANYSLGCDFANRRVYAIVRDFLLYYWSQNDSIIDYLLTDYLIVLAQKFDKKLNNALVSIEPNNPRCDDLFKILGEEYDEQVWNEVKKETALFKLSWKHEFPMEVRGKETFYAKVLNGSL